MPKIRTVALLLTAVAVVLPGQQPIAAERDQGEEEGETQEDGSPKPAGGSSVQSLLHVAHAPGICHAGSAARLDAEPIEA